MKNLKRGLVPSEVDGFTLIEILIVMIILGILSVLVTGNFVNSLKKGRDARRKSDLEQIRNALEMYYEDKKDYPQFDIFAASGNKLCESQDCTDASGNPEKIYMQSISNDPKHDPADANSPSYRYCYSPNAFRLHAQLENTNDMAAGTTSTAGMTCVPAGACDGSDNCNYGMSSPNTTL